MPIEISYDIQDWICFQNEPIFTWGFVLSKAVASPLYWVASRPKTCCTGLTLLWQRMIIRKDRAKGTNALVDITIMAMLRRSTRTKAMATGRNGIKHKTVLMQDFKLDLAQLMPCTTLVQYCNLCAVDPEVQ